MANYPGHDYDLGLGTTATRFAGWVDRDATSSVYVAIREEERKRREKELEESRPFRELAFRLMRKKAKHRGP